MFNQLTPVYLSSVISQQVNAISHHNLRNSNDIHTIRSNTSLYHNSLLPSTLRQWNSLPVDVRQLLNITESPLCQCGSIKDTQHYFFHCRFYQGPRNTLLNACITYQNPSLSLLLFGSSILSLEASIAILEQVHKYILTTKRFT